MTVIHAHRVTSFAGLLSNNILGAHDARSMKIGQAKADFVTTLRLAMLKLPQ
jgi:hypothetical protein